LDVDRNLADAQFTYAWCLEHGWGVQVELTGAAKYYKIAADHKLAAAQYN
jgi:TPR repeat protein